MPSLFCSFLIIFSFSVPCLCYYYTILPQNQLETAAYVHDIGIKISEEKYNSSAGKYQEIEGPPIAEEMLTKLGYDKDVIERVSYLVGHP